MYTDQDTTLKDGFINKLRKQNEDDKYKKVRIMTHTVHVYTKYNNSICIDIYRAYIEYYRQYYIYNS